MPFLHDRQCLRIRWDIYIVCLTFLIGIAVSNPPNVLLLKNDPHFTSWLDQGKYLKSASAFYHGNLNAREHWYPLLYPLLLAPFSFLPPLLTVLIPDLICYVTTYIAYRDVVRHFNVSTRMAVLLFLPATVVYYQTGDGWIQPWTTTLSCALIWIALALAARILDLKDEERLNGSGNVLLGGVLGAIPLCRPADIVVSGMIGLCIIYATLYRRRLWSDFSTILLSCLAIACSGGALHFYIYGPHPSDYMKLSSAYGANLRWLGWKAYIILIEPMPWYPFGQGLFKILPWLPLGVAGILVNIKTAEKRAQALLLLLPAAAYLIVMLSYIDLLPSGLWKYGNVHYFKWIFPILSVFCWIFIRDFRLHRTVSVIAFIAVLLPCSLHINPIPAKPDEPARMVVFSGIPAEFSDIYFARSVIQDKKGALLNTFDYHQVPDKKLIFAEALRRDFAGGERWIHPGDGVSWPEPNPNIRPRSILPGTFPAKALERYKPRVTIGWPCWLPPYGCSSGLQPNS